MIPGKTILLGRIGSRAHGLARDDSDEDFGGIYVAPTDQILSLHGVKETVVDTEPDATYHEVAKFLRLALAANPTILEVLWAEHYILTDEGKLIVDGRSAFLSKRVYKTYAGYAMCQLRKLQARAEEGKQGFSSETKNRYAKHARHCFRLLWQGKRLVESGNVFLRVENPHKLWRIEELSLPELEKEFEQAMDEFESAYCVLPDEPNLEGVERMLRQIREMNWPCEIKARKYPCRRALSN